MTEADAQRQRAMAAREALVGRTIAAGRYRILGLLGHGGMGAVYEAEHLGLGKIVAIKFVDQEFATDPQVLGRFAREARAMSAIESSHIVTVFDSGAEDGRPYLVMERLRGEDLGQRLARLQRVPPGEALHIVAQVLKGLGRAHAAGILHRDLKPDNVFLVKHDLDPDFAKIVDFGVSKIERPRATTLTASLTRRGTILGTPFYMSPEQAQAVPDLDARTDLYSVGAILFECLTGRPPHVGESYEQVILSICMRAAPDVRAVDPSIPAPLAAFVARALERDRSARFPNAAAMLAELHRIAPAERARVPAERPAVTLRSAETELAPPSDRALAKTRVGVARLDGGSSERDTIVDPEPIDREPVDPEPVPSVGPEPARVVADRASRPRPPAAPLAPSARHGWMISRTMILTAAAATVTGALVVTALVSVFGRPDEALPPLPTVAAEAPAPAIDAAALEASDASAPSAIPEASPAASASTPAASASTPAASASTPTPSRVPPSPRGARSAAPSAASARSAAPSAASARSAAPSPSEKPLDIQRELP